MRVLWLTENHPPSRGGMAESCDRIVRGLRGAGVTIDVAHLTRRGTQWKVGGEVGGRLFVVPVTDDPEHALRRLSVQVAGEAYDVVVAFGGALPVLAAPVLAAWLDARLVTLLRGNDFDTGVFSLRRRGPLLDALRASARVCVVASAHRRLVETLVPGQAVTWVANGLDLQNWAVLPSERQEADRWRCSAVAPGVKVLGLIGQLKRKKGVDFLLDALVASGHAGAIHLMLVGDLEEGLSERLTAVCSHTLLPFLDRYELPAIYARCDAVALPSFYDGLPNVALEAAGLGVPLLSSDAGGLADLVDEKIGFVFAAGDPHACRAALDRFVKASDDDLVARGVEASDRVRRHFTPSAETDGYLAVLAEVTGG